MAIKLNGTTDEIGIGAADLVPSPLGWSGITMAAWFNTPTLPGAGIYYSIMTYSGHFGLWIKGPSGMSYAVDTNGGEKFIEPLSGLSANTWYHGAFHFAIGSSTIGQGFINGLPDGGSFADATAANFLNETIIKIGNDPFNERMNGMVADAAIWNRALTRAEIYLLAKGVLRPHQIYPRPMMHQNWPFDGYDGIGNDLSYRKIIGVVTGTPTFAIGPPAISPLRQDLRTLDQRGGFTRPPGILMGQICI